MKSNKGITLVSLAIYISVALIVLAILVRITLSFQNSVNNINEKGANNYEIDKFNVYFLQEVKKTNNDISSISESEISFTSNNKYTFKDGCIYLNDNIKIAENIRLCTFSKEMEDKKTIIVVNIMANNSEEVRRIDFVLQGTTNNPNYEDENIYVR